MTQTDSYHALMLDHAAGALPPALQLAADIHLELNRDGALNGVIWAAIGGVLLERIGVNDAIRPVLKRAAWPALKLSANEVIEQSERPQHWKKNWFGMEYLPVKVDGGKLLKLRPGRAAPKHSHDVQEVTVVLHGAFEDVTGRYQRGDLAIAEPGLTHTPIAVGDRDCICFAAEAPVSMFGRLRRFLH